MRKPDSTKSIFNPLKYGPNSWQSMLQAAMFAAAIGFPLIAMDQSIEEEECSELEALYAPCGEPLDPVTEAQLDKIFEGGRNCNGSTGPVCI